ncbi:hypothetical protein QR680_010993 [Steinernema hermaphroditum]|uniref:Nematode cuticle collagen N-terminal domain-containing protein n=1 Tax=Steinernema hermaphroditum TaxID=289476 RepID=A0AA39IQS0_9BILA|nr:hypothetical protein QR680_010993 [Steinernema hermaphroditum]
MSASSPVGKCASVVVLGATTFCAFFLTAALIGASFIYNDIVEMEGDLRGQMGHFKRLTDEAWDQMIVSKPRQKRQYVQYPYYPNYYYSQDGYATPPPAYVTPPQTFFTRRPRPPIVPPGNIYPPAPVVVPPGPPGPTEPVVYPPASTQFPPPPVNPNEVPFYSTSTPGYSTFEPTGTPGPDEMVSVTPDYQFPDNKKCNCGPVSNNCPAGPPGPPDARQKLYTEKTSFVMNLVQSSQTENNPTQHIDVHN